MEYLPYNDIDYCKYGFDYRKRTRVWNNNNNWNGKILCNHRKDGKHLNFRWITRGPGVCSRWEQRIMIPKDLMEEIILSSV